jgi:hypothetical protein
VAMSILSSRSPMSAGQPEWYKLVLPVIGVLGAVVGGVVA